jgi:hypothetical protein
VDRYGLPESLEGKTALDIGTADGFWRTVVIGYP